MRKITDIDTLSLGLIVMDKSIESTTAEEKDQMLALATAVYIEYFQDKLPIGNFGIFAAAILDLLGRNVKP